MERQALGLPFLCAQSVIVDSSCGSGYLARVDATQVEDRPAMIHLRPMTAADLPLGLHLSRQAGSDQIDADCRRTLALQPDGCFVAEWQGTPAGTTTTCIFGSVAWVAMVLVE